VGFDGIIPEEVALLYTSRNDDPERITFTPLKEAVYAVVAALVKSSDKDAVVNPVEEIIGDVAEVYDPLATLATNNEDPP
jgi:hypothetical protein